MYSTGASVEVVDFVKVVVVMFALLTVTPDSLMFHPCKAGLLACGSMRTFAFPPTDRGQWPIESPLSALQSRGRLGFWAPVRADPYPIPVSVPALCADGTP